MKKLLLLLAFCAFSLSAQKSAVTDEEMKYAIDASVKMSESETFLTLTEKTFKMMGKLPADTPPTSLEEPEKFEPWLRENLSKTKFASVDEGMKLYTELHELEEKLESENKKLFEIMERANPEQRAKFATL